MPTHKLLIAYCRQSTKKQFVSNIYSSQQQTEELIARVGWSEHMIKLFIENQMAKNGKIRTSGRLPIDVRGGLSAVVEHIERDEVGACIVVDISRLFRDEDKDEDGNTIERAGRVVRYQQTGSEENTALLAGCRHDGGAVIEGVGSQHVYANSGGEYRQINYEIRDTCKWLLTLMWLV